MAAVAAAAGVEKKRPAVKLAKLPTEILARRAVAHAYAALPPPGVAGAALPPSPSSCWAAESSWAATSSHHHLAPQQHPSAAFSGIGVAAQKAHGYHSSSSPAEALESAVAVGGLLTSSAALPSPAPLRGASSGSLASRPAFGESTTYPHPVVRGGGMRSLIGGRSSPPRHALHSALGPSPTAATAAAVNYLPSTAACALGSDLSSRLPTPSAALLGHSIPVEPNSSTAANAAAAMTATATGEAATFAEIAVGGRRVVGRQVRIRSFADPVTSFTVTSNFSSVVGDGLTKLLRSLLKPAIDSLMTEGFLVPIPGGSV